MDFIDVEEGWFELDDDEDYFIPDSEEMEVERIIDFYMEKYGEDKIAR